MELSLANSGMGRFRLISEGWQRMLAGINPQFGIR